MSEGRINDNTSKNVVKLKRGGRRQNTDVNNLKSSTVQIQTGIYRHHVGMVLDATATHVQVELHARHKVVTILLKNIKKLGGKEGRMEDDNSIANAHNEDSWDMNDAGMGAGGATPSGASGFDGGSTPMGNNTPGGNFDVQATPMAEEDNFMPDGKYFKSEERASIAYMESTVVIVIVTYMESTVVIVIVILMT